MGLGTPDITKGENCCHAHIAYKATAHSWGLQEHLRVGNLLEMLGTKPPTNANGKVEQLSNRRMKGRSRQSFIAHCYWDVTEDGKECKSAYLPLFLSST